MPAKRIDYVLCQAEHGRHDAPTAAKLSKAVLRSGAGRAHRPRAAATARRPLIAPWWHEWWQRRTAPRALAPLRPAGAGARGGALRRGAQLRWRQRHHRARQRPPERGEARWGRLRLGSAHHQRWPRCQGQDGEPHFELFTLADVVWVVLVRLWCLDGCRMGFVFDLLCATFRWLLFLCNFSYVVKYFVWISSLFCRRPCILLVRVYFIQST